MLSKKLVLILRSVNSIVIPPAKTGNDKTSKKTVIKTLQIKSGIFSNLSKLFFTRKIVTKKLIEPTIEDIPAI
jgi:hypothetical protein